jgi:hypothetical protein
MTKDEKTLRALESFIESYTMRGACGAFVVPRPLDEVRGYHVHLYIDINWIGKQEVRPHLVSKKFQFLKILWRRRLMASIKKTINSNSSIIRLL